MSDYKIKDSGDRTEYKTGAVRDARGGKGRFDLIPPSTLLALAIHYDLGCKKYGDRNWEKGIPVGNYIDSGMRHVTKVLAGVKDGENHLMAGIWNFFCAYETILRIQRGELPEDLYNIPKKITLPDPLAEE